MKKAAPILLLAILIISCFKKPVTNTLEPANLETNHNIEKKKDIEEFSTFYDKFHNDSVFQIKRVKFPISGGRTDDENSYKWNKNNWMFMSNKIRDIDTGMCKINIVENDSIVIENLDNKDNSGYHFNTLYKLIDGKWYLIECNYINL